MKNLILDFDNTQANSLPILTEFINQMFGIESTPDDHRYLKIEKILEKYEAQTDFTTDEIYYHFIQRFQTSVRWQSRIKPIPGLTEVLPRLAEKYNIYTCSSRQTAGIDNIRIFSEEYVPGCIKGIHCVYHYVGPGYTKISKAKFIKALPGENVLFVDDCIHELTEVKDLVPTLLFGQTKDQHDFPCAADWWEVEKALSSL
jgi:hypothetical protein